MRIANVAAATASVIREVSEAQYIAKEAVLLDVQAEELRQLVEHDHEPDPRLESGEHRRRNEVGNESQPQQARQQQHGADECAERRRRREKSRRIAVWHDQPELSPGEDRQRGGRTHAQYPRGSEQRVDQHRNECGVQANGDRQPGHRRVGHGLWQHDSGRGKAGDDVELPQRGLRRRNGDR
jgi:hypothetical protein